MSMVAVVVVVLLHAAYLVFQTLGALLALRHPRWLWVHPLAVIWGVGIVAFQGGCPLTRLEKLLMARSGETPYQGSFLDRYLFGVLVPDGSQALVYGLHLLVILATYAFVLTRLRTRALVPAAAPPRVGV
jgi:hypothetical protein